jgi:hypothetical protein
VTPAIYSAVTRIFSAKYFSSTREGAVKMKKLFTFAGARSHLWQRGFGGSQVWEGNSRENTPDFRDFRTGVSMYYEPKGTMEKPRVEDLYGAKLPPIPKPYHRKPQTVKKMQKSSKKTLIIQSKLPPIRRPYHFESQTVT